MRRAIRRLVALYEKHSFAIDIALIAAGANAVRRRVIELNGRLEAIENGGMVPRDDLVTLRDLDNKVGPVLLSHQQALVDAGLLDDPRAPIDVEVVEDGPQDGTEATGEPQGAAVGQEGTEGP